MRAAAETALRVDPLLPEAQEAMGMAYARDGRWEQSEKSFRRAIELGGGRSDAYNAFPMYFLFPLGRTEEAIRQLRIAEKTGRLSPDVQYFLSVLLTSVGRYDEAAAYWDKSPADDSWRITALGRIRLAQGKVDEAIQIFEPKYRQMCSKGSPIRAEAGCGYARAGRREEAEQVAASSSDNPFNQAPIYACQGDKERVFEALNRATPAGPIRIGRE